MAKKREIPRKNYYILGVLLIATIALVCYVGNWYRTDQEYKQRNSIITSIISEVKEEELSSYLVDNANIVIYFASSQDLEIKGFEKEFKKYIVEEELKDQIIYVNTRDIKENKFYQNIIDQYFDSSLKNKNINLNYIPNLVIMKDGKIKDVMITYDVDISMTEVEAFFIKNGVVIK